ncbi:sensor domain-containing diguanylate cyclase [Marinobacter sp. S0848L]|uniref:GGDEF domain-containing protein n=1 Tax=Marinobacter sp. S0848L TaxID=2926423 RepID=UPI001FF6576D|nr:sensor domain-containing diguanylate cyclase [Marinobacter sp. S0848L]MCK0106542.1 sensor domain-containing diguanylate cyclase [Marinobacter sp. S0848L]
MTSKIPSTELPDELDTHAPATMISAGGLQAVLDNLDALVYVSDFETHELLYMNAYGRQRWGEVDGRKCWQVLQNAGGPCRFCTNHLLRTPEGSPTPPHVWEFQNRVDQRWYQCRDQAIPWTDGKLVRLEIATDISARKEIELALQEAHERAQAAALEDELTGLPNRRAVFQFGHQMLHQALRNQSTLSMVMVDLDFFKRVNDTYGHQAGDEVLIRVSKVMQARLRESDLIARMGGEEFVLLLPETPINKAREIAQQLLVIIRALGVPHEGHTIKLTASFGITSNRPNDPNLEALLKRADQALYQSKEQGRDRISLYTD